MLNRTKAIKPLLVGLCLVAGCMSPWGRGHVEPPIFIVRNSTAQDFQMVLVRAPQREDLVYGAGRVTPLLRQSSFIYHRPSPPKPMESPVDVVWVDRQAKSHHQIVSLDEVLSQATGQPGEALVFEITQDRGVQVYLEQTSPGPQNGFSPVPPDAK